MEQTLVHEDIYIFADPIIEVIETQTGGNSFDFANNATEQVADLGLFEIEIVSGSYTQVVITSGNKTAAFNVELAVGNILTLDFRNLSFKKDCVLVFTDDVPVLTDNTSENIDVTLTGSGIASVTRTYEKAQLNNNDIWFVESLSVDKNIERLKKTMLNGQEKTLKGEKKTYSFSINGLWSQTEMSKFTNKFRLRLVDEEGAKLETLANCYTNSINKSSSSGSDLTYSLSGSCEEIF